jgi:hypothetical protein
MARKKDDSNKFVVSVTAFNRTARDPLLLITLLSAMIVLWWFVYEQMRKATT